MKSGEVSIDLCHQIVLKHVYQTLLKLSMFIREHECEPTKKFQRRGRNRKGDREQLSPLGQRFSSPVQHALSFAFKAL